MTNLTNQIMGLISKRNYQPVKAKALAKRLGVSSGEYPAFRKLILELIKAGRIELAKNQTIRPTSPHGTITGIYRRTSTGVGYVRPPLVEGQPSIEVRIREDRSLDAATGDTVLVKIRRKPNRPDMNPSGEIVRVLERGARHFVGSYFERQGQGYVRVDGTVFSHSVEVGDPGAHGVQPDDKVVIEMIRFPGPQDRGEGVITEVLGPRGKPGVDTLSVIRSYQLPDIFPDNVLEEARDVSEAFNEKDLEDRRDFTRDLVITIDPVDARDFDDAISVQYDAQTGHWKLDVHIADVAHFVLPGGPLDREARNRATSIYLPQRVIPMFPELISNHLASLQPNKVRFVKSVLMEFTPEGQRAGADFANGAIQSKRRFTYEEVMSIVGSYPEDQDPDTADPGLAPTLAGGPIELPLISMLLHLRRLALVLRSRRRKRGSLELNMPEIQLEYDSDGKVSGAHHLVNDISHQMIEECMLAANEAVAEHLDQHRIPFLRRIHPDPIPKKLAAFGEFARSLNYKVGEHVDRFTLQKILEKSAGKPDAHAIHYALLRSLKQAVYSPAEEGHYALASDNYCHFTSPIRRYPDLTVHRLLDRWMKKGKANSNEVELITLGEHCSKMERRAETAERELVRLKLLNHMSERVGSDLNAIITGVADYGFFAQGVQLPVEGLVHISTLMDDYYYYEERTHSLIGRRTNRTYRLGDSVRVNVVRVDLQRRQLDFRVTEEAPASEKKPSRRQS